MLNISKCENIEHTHINECVDVDPFESFLNKQDYVYKKSHETMLELFKSKHISPDEKTHQMKKTLAETSRLVKLISDHSEKNFINLVNVSFNLILVKSNIKTHIN